MCVLGQWKSALKANLGQKRHGKRHTPEIQTVPLEDSKSELSRSSAQGSGKQQVVALVCILEIKIETLLLNRMRRLVAQEWH